MYGALPFRKEYVNDNVHPESVFLKRGGDTHDQGQLRSVGQHQFKNNSVRFCTCCGNRKESHLSKNKGSLGCQEDERRKIRQTARKFIKARNVRQKQGYNNKITERRALKNGYCKNL